MVSEKSSKNDKNYRKFPWCRKYPTKNIKIIENFDGVVKNLLKSVENYRKFR